MSAENGREIARQGLAQFTAERMRDVIFDCEPGTRIGSLNSLAEDLEVGIVTVQQAARVLEHEGLLEVRRGPGGGYFGQRPGVETMQAMLGAYMRAEPASWQEALDMTSLLFNELAAAAAASCSDEHRAGLEAIRQRIGASESMEEVSALELDFQSLLFRMVNRPLFELITRVTLQISTVAADETISRNLTGFAEWKDGRCRIINAILEGDEELARFEADRKNRQPIMKAIAGKPVSGT